MLDHGILMRRISYILAVAALIGSTALAIRAMDEATQSAVNAPSTVTVTVQTDDGAAFRLNGRVILSDSAIPDTVTVEIWKNGSKTIHWFVPVPDSTSERMFLSMPRSRVGAK